ncbi:MAG: hypothetical protein KC503_31870, partial [Myxococcales bacterium]|nr:hypothetical protein [Myxococcales bacterium]
VALLDAEFPDEDGWSFVEDDEVSAAPTPERARDDAARPAALADDDGLAGDDEDDDGPIAAPVELEREPDDPDGDQVFSALDEMTDDEWSKTFAGQLRCVVPVRLGVRANKVEDFDAGELDVRAGENVVVETDRGLAIGTVVYPPMRRMVRDELPRVLRTLDANDQRQRARNEQRQDEAFSLCHERIRARELPMKLVRVEYLHSGNKALFYFAAESRVDFRELVRDLARKLHVRIEMRQVGVRDAAGLTGGIGSCGQQLCCSRFLQRFDPVSIRMAKDQNLVLNPTKVSGQCGRLKCCLAYEQKLYHEARKGLPKTGKRVETPDGRGIVREVDILRRLVRVLLEEGKLETYPANLVTAADRAGGPGGGSGGGGGGGSDSDGGDDDDKPRRRRTRRPPGADDGAPPSADDADPAPPA